jgi:2-haloacid dehalogenase
MTFDTYGTPIDWQSALVAYISNFLCSKGEDINAKTFYRVWYHGYALPAVVNGPYMPYRRLLQMAE